jgi:general stress protein 26
MTEDLQRIHALLEDFDTAMLVTHGGDFAHARPMAIARVEPDCKVWFFTRRSSGTVHEIQDDQNVLIVCQDEFRFITLSGRAEFVAERAKEKEVWSDAFKTWFPAGLAEPELLLICVHPEGVEYWDSRAAGSHTFEVGAAGARTTRSRVIESKQHGKVTL